MEIDSYTKQFLKESLKHHVAMHQDTFYYLLYGKRYWGKAIHNWRV